MYWELLITVIIAYEALVTGAVHRGECHLNCLNGGYCEFVDGDVNDLAYTVQSGKMIEKCVCQPGYGGTACEIEIEECQLPERKCHNGLPCARRQVKPSPIDKTLSTEDEIWTCDCTLADRVSEFAGAMCRKPFTEYCGGRYDPGKSLTFCTNGGKCKSDFIAAEIAPRNVSVNLAYQHMGCVCNPGFYGPHCEYLRYGKYDEDAEKSTEKQEAPSAVVPLIAAALGMVALLACLEAYRRHRNRTGGTRANIAGFMAEDRYGPRKALNMTTTNMVPLEEGIVANGDNRYMLRNGGDRMAADGGVPDTSSPGRLENAIFVPNHFNERSQRRYRRLRMGLSGSRRRGRPPVFSQLEPLVENTNGEVIEEEGDDDDDEVEIEVEDVQDPGVEAMPRYDQASLSAANLAAADGSMMLPSEPYVVEDNDDSTTPTAVTSSFDDHDSDIDRYESGELYLT